MISDRLNDVRKRIAEAAWSAARRRPLWSAGRNAADINLVCVTKTAGISQIEEALASGVADIGEGRVRDALIKFKAIGNKARWHLIGHLQTNKVKDAVYIFDLIHSVDSVRLAQEISRQASKTGKIQEILLEVKSSPEPAKYGVSPDELFGFVEEISSLPAVKIKGLMTMAPVVSNPEDARPYFKLVRELSEELAAKRIKNVEINYLSMGMSQDFEVAIEEGANMVRIGSAIFGR